MKRFSTLFARATVLGFLLTAAIGCGSDPAADANKKLQPVDPNAPRPSAASGASAGGGGGPAAGAGVVK